MVDGALVNPVPVSVCRAYEQPLVVAVNLHYDLFGRAAVIKHSAGELMLEQDASPAAPASAGSREARIGLTGHAKNLVDGSVEVLACGDAAALDDLQRWLGRGPPAARVDTVTSMIVDVPPPASFTTA